MHVYIDGKRHRLDPTLAIGKGGEADVYRLSHDTAVKIYKQPDHPDFAGFPHEQQAAKARIDEHQRKLREFPRMLPASVVAPISLATDRDGSRVLGFTMRFLDGVEVLLRYSERSFRGSGIDNGQVARLFLGMHPTLRALHAAGVVAGDFNDLNILVVPSFLEAHFIDADSFQFGPFLCRVYTEKFVDPVLCDPKATRPALARPHNEGSDWYAYNVMLMKCLTFCDPYGGVYRPPKGRPDVLHAARPLRRITVFDKNVRYPKPAMPYGRLPDELLHHFHLVFEKDERGEFPLALLQRFRWTKCAGCGAEHGRPSCPECQKAAPAAVVQTVQVRGKVTATRVFKTAGEIVFAAWQGDAVRYVYVDQDERGYFNYRREGGSIVVQSTGGPLKARWRISGAKTLFGSDGRFRVRDPLDSDETPTHVDSYGALPVFDATESRRFWARDGALFRDADFAPERIGEVLQNQTLFWVGPGMGFGFYRAGELSVAFVFETERKGLNDSVRIPALRGHLVDSTCFFSSDRCWFLASLKHEGRIVNRCTVVRPDGSVEATAEAEQGDGSWLGEIRGKCASGRFLFAVTDEGVVRVEPAGGSIAKTAEFPDTEPFVDSGCQLLPAKSGLHVVDRQEIRLLKIG